MKYRVLHILYSLNIGGAENFIMNVYRSIDREMIQFDFLVHKKDFFDDEVVALGGKVHYIDGYVKDLGIHNYRKVIHDFFKNGEGKKYKIVHVHVNQTSGLIIPIIKRTSNAICYAHSHDLQNYNNCVIAMYKRLLQIFLNRYADYRLACSREAGEWLFKDKPFYIIDNGIDFTKFKFSLSTRNAIRNELGISESTIVLGHVGRFEEVKNQGFLVELFEKMPEKDDLVLLLIGEGSLKESIRKEVNEKKMSDFVRILPAVSDVEKYYNAMDIFLFPSYKEALGIVGIEAQVNGLPVIASQGVCKKMKICKNVKFIELDCNKWMEFIDIIKKNAVLETLENRKEICVGNDFDIRVSRNKLIELYDEGVLCYENSHK